MYDYYFRCRDINNKTTRPDLSRLYCNLKRREFLDIVSKLLIFYHEVSVLRISNNETTMYTTDQLFRLVDKERKELLL